MRILDYARDDVEAAAAVSQGPAILRPQARASARAVVPLDAKKLAGLARGLSRRVHGLFPSAKNGKSMPWNRRDQRDLMLLLELDPEVISYQPKPEQVCFAFEGGLRRHIPAFRVHTTRGDIILDIFTPAEERSAAGQALIGAVREAYAPTGTRYCTVSSTSIHTEPRFTNARWVYSMLACDVRAATVHQLTFELSRGPRRIAHLRALLHEALDVDAALCAMALRRQVRLNLSAQTPDLITVELHASGAPR